MKNNLTKDKIPFTQIPNALITDTNISAGAVRVYSYMQSKPDNWNFYNNDIKKSLDIKANETLAGYFKELINQGWISREREQKNGKYCGGYDYTVHFEQIFPNSKKVHIKNNSTLGKTHNSSNKDYSNNKEKDSNKEKRDLCKKSKDFSRVSEDKKFSKFDYTISKEFLAYQQSEFPKLVNDSQRAVEKGADTVRLLREQDDFTEEEIAGTLRFAVKDDFWRDKALSVANIRKRSRNGNTKFQNIYRKFKNSPKSKTKQVMDMDISGGEEFWKM